LNLWVYTGYTWEELLEMMDCPGFSELIDVANIIVDGRFEASLRDNHYRFRGSANQRLIDVRASLKSGKPVEWYLNNPIVEEQRWAGIS